MMTYLNQPDSSILVHLEKKFIGTIKKVKDGWQYFPKGQKEGGEIFSSAGKVKQSLESED